MGPEFRDVWLVILSALLAIIATGVGALLKMLFTSNGRLSRIEAVLENLEGSSRDRQIIVDDHTLTIGAHGRQLATQREKMRWIELRLGRGRHQPDDDDGD